MAINISQGVITYMWPIHVITLWCTFIKQTFQTNKKTYTSRNHCTHQWRWTLTWCLWILSKKKKTKKHSHKYTSKQPLQKNSQNHHRQQAPIQHQSLRQICVQVRRLYFVLVNWFGVIRVEDLSVGTQLGREKLSPHQTIIHRKVIQHVGYVGLAENQALNWYKFHH